MEVWLSLADTYYLRIVWVFLKTTKFEKAMADAQTYQEWRAAALAFDEMSGNNKWKTTDSSEHFDYRSIRDRLENLKRLRLFGYFQGILFALNEGIHGNVGGMGKSILYQRAKIGTKRLIEDYIDEIVKYLELLSTERAGISCEERISFFKRARLCFGQTALMMSGSGTLAYFHFGVAKTLWQQGLLPSVLSGSSGGALICSIFATRNQEELNAFFSSAEMIRHGNDSRHWFNKYKFEIISTDHYRQLVDKLVPDLTFEEAFVKTNLALNISIAPASTHQTSRLLNAITTPNVLIREAIMASSAIPGIFPSVTLRAKDRRGKKVDYLPERQWVDGAISDDLPAKRLSRLYGVNHFVVSQTNPHILPFISERKSGISSTLKRAMINTSRVWINAGAGLLNNSVSKNSSINQVSNALLSVINQDYMGDINILPPFKFRNPGRLLAPLTQSEIYELIEIGERTTWPKIGRINTQTEISRALQLHLTNQLTRDEYKNHSELMRAI
jgi:NTE family protein